MHGDQGKPEKLTENIALGKNHTKIAERSTLKLGCLDVRTMFTGLSENVQNIYDVRNTGVIHHVDIATFQKTCMAGSGKLREKDHLSLAWEGSPVAQRA